MDKIKCMTGADMDVAMRVLNDIRKEFPIRRDPMDIQEKREYIENQHIWDVLAELQEAYKEEMNRVLEDQAYKYGGL